MAIIQNTVYCADGERLSPPDLESTFELLRSRGAMAWIGLYRPDTTEVDAVASEFGLHPLAVEDAVSAHQRPKLERYGDVLFTVLRPAAHLDGSTELGELHVFTGPDFVLTVRHAERPDLGELRRRLEREGDVVARGPERVLHAILDQVVDDYGPVLDSIETRADEAEQEAFATEPDASRRVHDLTREAGTLSRSVSSTLLVVRSLLEGCRSHGVSEEQEHVLRNVEDHVLRLSERIEALRQQLQNVLTVGATLVTQRQTEEMQRLTEATYRQGEQVKRISSWAAILFAPTLVPTVYGMNFTHMPELGWRLGYPFALVAMVLMFTLLYVLFRRKGWL